jgi:hypothetical protein
VPASALPPIGARVAGRLEFRDGDSVPVAGRVGRVVNGDVAVSLEGTAVPLPIIWAEQRFLRTHYLQPLEPE